MAILISMQMEIRHHRTVTKHRNCDSSAPSFTVSRDIVKPLGTTIHAAGGTRTRVLAAAKSAAIRAMVVGIIRIITDIYLETTVEGPMAASVVAAMVARRTDPSTVIAAPSQLGVIAAPSQLGAVVAATIMIVVTLDKLS